MSAEKTEYLSKKNRALARTVQIVEQILEGNQAFKKVDDRLYVVRQGSAYVMLVVLPLGEDRAIVRLAAQVVTGIEMTGELALRLLRLNAKLRFGAFGFQDDGDVVTLSHSVVGGETLDPEDLLAALEDVALIADELDDKLVKIGGGDRMQDLLEHEALDRIHAEVANEGEPVPWDE